MKKKLLGMALLAAVSTAPLTASAQTGADFDITVLTNVTGDLTTFTVNPYYAAGYDYLAPGDAFSSITITSESGFSASPVANGFSNNTVTFSPAITRSATYTFTFPYGAFNIGEYEDTAIPSMQKSFTVDIDVTRISDATFTLSPAFGSKIDLNEDGSVTSKVTFSRPMRLNEYKYGQKRDNDLLVVPEPGENVYATEYSLTFPKSYVDNIIYGWDPTSGLQRRIFATLYAVDEEGGRLTRVENGFTYDDISIQYVLNVDLPAGAPFEVSVPKVAKDELDHFNVSTLEGFNYIAPVWELSWDQTANNGAGAYVNFYTSIAVTNADGTFSANAVITRAPGSEGTEGFNGTVTFEPAITESGTYQLYIPYHAFSIAVESGEPGGQSGNEGDMTFWSSEQNIEFTVEITDFEVPKPMVIVPLGAQAETLNNMFEITWGYYGIVDNAGDSPMEALLTFPDGTEKTVKGEITDANGVEIGVVKEQPTFEDNALMFRNFLAFDSEAMRYIFQKGTYTVNIPEGVVLVNGFPNPAATLSFEITGEWMPEEPDEPVGPDEPETYHAAFSFTFPESFDAADLTVTSLDESGEELQGYIENGILTVEYSELPAGYLFSVPSDYQITVTAPADLTADTDYKITPGTIFEGYYSLSVELYAGADGSTFGVAIARSGNSAVEAPAEAPASYDVYTLTGVKVMTTGRLSYLKTVAPGMYIINGKIMIIPD